MRARRLAATAAVFLMLAGCSAPPETPPVVVEANEINGKTVEVPLDGTLYVETGDLGVDSYEAEIADESIATFEQGTYAGDFAYYPSFLPAKVGETEVTMINEDGGIQNIEFTLRVTPAP